MHRTGKLHYFLFSLVHVLSFCTSWVQDSLRTSQFMGLTCKVVSFVLVPFQFGSVLVWSFTVTLCRSGQISVLFQKKA